MAMVPAKVMASSTSCEDETHCPEDSNKGSYLPRPFIANPLLSISEKVTIKVLPTLFFLCVFPQNLMNTLGSAIGPSTDE